MVLNSFSLFPSNFSLQEISYSYNPTNGLASSWTNSASGIFCSYEYDIMDRPISLAWKASDGSIIKSYNYMYSNSDMITNVVDNTGNITKYEFDTLDRLTSEDDGDNITAYSYDLAGNRTQKILTTNQTNLTNQYTLGVGNRLASWGTNGVARYNTAGCLTNMVSNTDGRELNLGWNSQYQLVSVDSVDSNEVGGKVSYDYNVLGQRVSRKEISGNTTNTEYYIHNGVNIVADLDDDKELLRSYSYAPGYDNIISMTSYGNETNTYFYIRNHNNSVVALIDDAGNTAESYEYTAYGEVTVFDSNGNELDESALGNRYTFQGREIDWSTGLYNFRARWYDAETGRWLSKDPIGINGGLNQYVFCGNNPVMFVDPVGLDRWVVDDILHSYVVVEKYEKFGDIYLIRYIAISFSIRGVEIFETTKPEESWNIRFIDSTCEEDEALLDFADEWSKIPLYVDIISYNVFFFNCRHATVILQGIGMENDDTYKEIMQLRVPLRPNVFLR